MGEVPVKPTFAAPDTTWEARDIPLLAVYGLGRFHVYYDEQLINKWPSQKGKAILKYMIAHRDRPIAKDILMDLFWADARPDAARNSLNVAMYSLRQAFRAVRPDYCLTLFQDEHYLLNPALPVWVDFEQFRQHYEAGQHLEQQGKLVEAVAEYEIAESLYQSDFLEEDMYEDWAIPQRESLKDSYLVILDRLSHYQWQRKRYAACIQLCQKILDKDHCREVAYRRLMRCYCRQGQPNLALRQYHLCVETLAQELDVPPMPETEVLYHQIRNREAV